MKGRERPTKLPPGFKTLPHAEDLPNVAPSDDAEPPTGNFMAPTPHSALRRTQQVGFYILLAYAALMTAPTTYYAIQRGLDPSWVYALNHFVHSPYKFGPDIIFTYGPLGFINNPQNNDWNLPIALFVRFLVWAVVIAEIESSYRRRRSMPPACFMAISAVIFVHALLRDFTDYMLASGVLLLILRQPPAWKQFWSRTIPLGLFCALAFLSKESSYVMVMAPLVVYFMLERLEEGRGPSRESSLRFALIICIPLFAYLLYNPSISGLWAYVTGVAATMGGYGAAMSLPVPPREFVRLGVLALFLLGFAVYAVLKRWLTVGSAACVISAFCVATKHGLVRDGNHLTFTYGFAIMLMATLILQCRDSKGLNLIGGCVFAAVCILSLTEMDPVWNTLSLEQLNPKPAFTAIGRLVQWNRSMSADAAETEANLREDRLPDELLKQIQRDPVIIFPSELSYAPANHLNLVPLYTLQTYQTYTHELDLRTAANLANQPPKAKLLMEWDSTEGRHPLLDVPATWDAIVVNYAPAAVESNHLLLEKRDHPRQFHSRPLSHAMTDLRTWQEVPDRDHAVRAAVLFAPTVFGSLRNILYKTDAIYLELEPDRGSPQRFRVIPDVLRHPFVVNCVPLNSAALESVVFENVCPQKIKRFRFLGDGLDSFPRFAEVAFTETVDEPFQFPQPKDAGWQDVTIPPDVPMVWAGVVDSVDGAPIPIGNSAANPLSITAGKKLEISGWAVSDPKAGEAFDTVFLIAGNRQLRAVTGLRPDVVKYLKNPRVSRSGFQIYADTSAVQRGDYVLKLVGRTGNGSYYRCPNQIFIRLK